MIRSSGIKYKDLVPGALLIVSIKGQERGHKNHVYVIISTSSTLVTYQAPYYDSKLHQQEFARPRDEDAFFLSDLYDVEVI